MPKNPTWSLGKTKRESVKTIKYYETFPTFWEISEDVKIKMPSCQHALDETKYKAMADEYRKDKHRFLYKNTIVIGVLNDTPYLIDGQHRIEMARYLVKTWGETDKEIERDTFRFCYQIVDNEMELRELFGSVNHDSERNKWYLDLDELVKIKMDEFTKNMTQKYKKHFANSIIKTPYKYTLGDFRKELEKRDFFKTGETADQLVKNLKKKNDEYLQFYSREIIENKSTFHHKDLIQIETGIVFTLLRNNFVNWYFNKRDQFLHKRKSVKKRISRKLKIACWEKELPNEEESKCPMPNCTIILCKNKLDTWQAGHVISEKNGGETSVNNLKPICKCCNLAMGCQNWNDYIIN